MPRTGNPRSVSLWLLALVAVSLCAAALTGVLYFRARSEQGARISKLEEENREARLRSESLARELDSARRGVAPSSETAPREPEGTGRPDLAGQLESSRFVYQLREKLAAAGAAIESLQARVHELQTSLDGAKQENARLAASESEAREKLNASSRVLEAVQAEVKGKGERLTQTEISNRLLKDENRTLSDKLNRVPPLIRELEDINRRRETHLGNVLRRYKEVTEQYRAVSDRLERSDAPASAPGPELSRINNTISMAEEDLRQLTALNAQAARIRQKLAGN